MQHPTFQNASSTKVNYLTGSMNTWLHGGKSKISNLQQMRWMMRKQEINSSKRPTYHFQFGSSRKEIRLSMLNSAKHSRPAQKARRIWTSRRPSIRLLPSEMQADYQWVECWMKSILWSLPISLLWVICQTSMKNTNWKKVRSSQRLSLGRLQRLPWKTKYRLEHNLMRRKMDNSNSAKRNHNTRLKRKSR